MLVEKFFIALNKKGGTGGEGEGEGSKNTKQKLAKEEKSGTGPAGAENAIEDATVSAGTGPAGAKPHTDSTNFRKN